MNSHKNETARLREEITEIRQNTITLEAHQMLVASITAANRDQADKLRKAQQRIRELETYLCVEPDLAGSKSTWNGIE